MADIYDILKINHCLVLVIGKEQISPDKKLLKSLLIGEGFFNATHEDFLLNPNLIEGAGLNEAFVELWNEPIFIMDNHKLKIAGRLSRLGIKKFRQSRQAFANDKPLLICGHKLSDAESDQRHLFQVMELKTATLLSLPAKKYAYALSDEKEWKKHENSFLRALDQRITKLQQQHLRQPMAS